MGAWEDRREELSRINATDAQCAAVTKWYGDAWTKNLKMGQAIKLLSVRDYVRGAAAIYLTRQNNISVQETHLHGACLAVLEDPELVEFIERWAKRRFHIGTMGQLPTQIRVTQQLQQVVDILCDQIDPPKR